MRNISKILGLLLLLPLFTGCNDSDDVAAIFTGKTWKLNYITVDGGHDMFPFWENEAQKTKIYEELNKNGTYNVIFEGTVEGDIIKGNIKGTVITTTGNFEGTWSANGKNNKFEATVEGNNGGDALAKNFLEGLNNATSYEGFYVNQSVKAFFGIMLCQGDGGDTGTSHVKFGVFAGKLFLDIDPEGRWEFVQVVGEVAF